MYEIKTMNECHPHAYMSINKNAMTCVLENACEGGKCESNNHDKKLCNELRKYISDKSLRQNILAFDQNLKQHLIFTKKHFSTRIKMDSQNMSYKAGQAKGEAQVFL